MYTQINLMKRMRVAIIAKSARRVIPTFSLVLRTITTARRATIAVKMAMNTQKMVLEGVMNSSIRHSAGRRGGAAATMRCALGMSPAQCWCCVLWC